MANSKKEGGSKAPSNPEGKLQAELKAALERKKPLGQKPLTQSGNIRPIPTKDKAQESLSKPQTGLHGRKQQIEGQAALERAGQQRVNIKTAPAKAAVKEYQRRATIDIDQDYKITITDKTTDRLIKDNWRSFVEAGKEAKAKGHESPDASFDTFLYGAIANELDTRGNLRHVLANAHVLETDPFLKQKLGDEKCHFHLEKLTFSQQNGKLLPPKIDFRIEDDQKTTKVSCTFKSDTVTVDSKAEQPIATAGKSQAKK